MLVEPRPYPVYLHGFLLYVYLLAQHGDFRFPVYPPIKPSCRQRNFFPYQCSGHGPFSTAYFGGFGLWVRVKGVVVIAIIGSLTLTITLITTLTII